MSRRVVVVGVTIVALGALLGFVHGRGLLGGGPRSKIEAAASTPAEASGSDQSAAAVARLEETLAETLDAAAANLRATLAELRLDSKKEPPETVNAVARKLTELESQAKTHRERAGLSRARIGASN